MAGESPFEMARRKILHLGRSLELLKHEKEALESREREHVRQLQAWRTIYQSEMPEDFVADEGNPEFEFAFPKDDLTAIPTFMSANTKTDACRRFCIYRGEEGIVTKDLTAFLAENRLDNNPGFASNFIFRMANSGELITRNGRLVATQKMRDAIFPSSPLEMPK